MENNKRSNKRSIHALLVLISVLMIQCQSGQQTGEPLYKNPEASIEDRVEDLLQRMTLEEKLDQISFINGKTLNKLDSHKVGFIYGFLQAYPPKQAAEKYNRIQKIYIEETRLGIPFMQQEEALFGVLGYNTTSLPISIALAGTWEPELVSHVAEITAREAHPRGIRQVLSPVVNLARDVRWGRFSETYGEDPYLSARMGVAYCKTMESHGIVTTPKHFVANMGLDGRFAGPIFFDERLLREKYFPAFKACFQEGNAKSVMGAYNSLNGLPCNANPWLLTEVLKNEWGFDGFVVSDGGALSIIYKDHKVAASKLETAAKAINAGCDADLDRYLFYKNHLKEAVEKGLVDEARIDDAVKRVLRQKFRTGLFENPYADPEKADSVTHNKEHLDIALDIARKSIILLKNDNQTLPFSKDIRSIALLGPLADELLVNHYAGYGRENVTLLKGFKEQYPHIKVYHEKAAGIAHYEDPAVPAKYLFHEKNGRMVQGLKGMYYNNDTLEGKPAFTRIDKQISYDWGTGAPEGLNNDHYSIRWTGKLKSPVTQYVHLSLTMDDGGRVYLDDKPVIDDWGNGAKHMADTIIKLEKGRVYDLKIEYFEGSLTSMVNFGWDATPEAYIPDALRKVSKADAAVVVCGMYDEENHDRASLTLSPSQEALIKAVSKTGKPMAVVLQSANVITMQAWEKEVPAIIEAWYPGEKGGIAIAEALLGDLNPGGKLPATFPQTIGQVPMNYNAYPIKARATYTVVGNEPLFPFGHGLSYTTFEYSNLKISTAEIKTDDSISISLIVKNTGNRHGDEVVQLYIHDKVASYVQPVKELKRFKRLSVEPGETKKVKFTLYPEDLAIWDKNMEHTVEPGDFAVMVGSSSEDIRMEKHFSVKK